MPPAEQPAGLEDRTFRGLGVELPAVGDRAPPAHRPRAARGGHGGLRRREPRPQPLYVGENFAAYSPDDRYLLAMKLFAARQRDFDDAVRLSTETGLTTAWAMRRLIDDAYYHNVIPAEIEDFIDDVARGVAQHRTNRGGLGLT